MLGRLVEILIRRRRIALLACAFAVAVLGIFAARVTVDNSLQAWFVEDDPALLAYRSFLKQFGNDELVVTAIYSDKDAFDPARLTRLWTLSHNLTALRV
jgi:predicted RND superfamily exporter protein